MGNTDPKKSSTADSHESSREAALPSSSDSSYERASLPETDDRNATMEYPKPDSTKPGPTDLLFSLPPELLMPKFSRVGVENFREDVRRRAVCREWYALTGPVLLGTCSLRLYASDLLPMIHGLRGRKWLAARQLTKHIELTIDRPRLTSSEYQVTRLTSRLEHLATELKGFDKLRSLTIVTRPARGCFLDSHVLPGFTALHQLTSLEIDLMDMDFEGPRVHLCDSISQLIPNLKRLRCRLPRICNDLLQTQPGGLEELILHIGAANKQTWPSDHCSNVFAWSRDELQPGLETRLVDFVASMRKPKMVRLINNGPYDAVAVVFDAIERQWLSLDIGSGWDADGELLSDDWDRGDQEEGDEDEESDEDGEGDEK
ncbi:hypothetical protein diail_6419 [Diaporthe ilicicola]|nr:hypothetical protein diail_6419 [Diaporthe ilicicola]